MNVERLLALALKSAGILGIGQTPNAEDINDAFDLLNMMIGQWNAQRWLAPHLIDVFIKSTGRQSYSIGSGGQFNIGRPDRIEFAYARNMTATPNPIDYPLDRIEAYEDYAMIPNKSLSSFPGQFFYDTQYPLGNVYFYPIPNNQFELHLIVKQTLAPFDNLKQQIIFPPAYLDALHWNMVTRLRIAYQYALDPASSALALGTLQQMRMANAQVRNLRMPAGLGKTWRGTNKGLIGEFTGVFTFGEAVLGAGDYAEQISLHSGTLPSGASGIIL